MFVKVRLSLFVELGRIVDLIIGVVDLAANAMAAAVIIVIRVVGCRMAMGMVVVSGGASDDRAKHGTSYDLADIVTVVIIHACTWVETVTTAMMITAHICKDA